jgi:hypothetical protein
MFLVRTILDLALVSGPLWAGSEKNRPFKNLQAQLTCFKNVISPRIR